MRICLSLLLALVALTNAALAGVGDVGVSDGSAGLQPTPSYMAGAAQSGGMAPESAGSQLPYYQTGSSGYAAPQGSSMQPLEYQQTLGGASIGQDIQMPQTGSLQPIGYPGYPSISDSQPSYEQGASSYQQSLQVPQTSASGAPQLTSPYQEHFSPDDLKFSQPQAENFQPDGSLNFAPASPPGDLLNTINEPSGSSSAISGTNLGTVSGSVPGAGSWYYPGSVSSRNKFYVQTRSGFRTVAGCNYGGYLPLWANIASSDNFYVYEWYPGQTSPYVRWWGWTWPGWKKGWFSGDVPGWHILCYYCRDASNYVYIYVWPGQQGSTGSATSGYSAYGGYSQTNQPQQQTSGYIPTGAPTPPDPNAESLMLPDFNIVKSGAAQTFNTVYPRPTSYRCNEYYVQTWPGRLATVGSVKCGEWLPLYSKIGRAGYYWSYEWAQGCISPGSFCYPEVKNFGYKMTGWYSTWFRGNRLGWHVLTYYCGDWSNYIYIYVWPSS
jgi:hypothetical protein